MLFSYIFYSIQVKLQVVPILTFHRLLLAKAKSF